MRWWPLAVLVGCRFSPAFVVKDDALGGDDDAAIIDARDIDARVIDAAIDAKPIDAAIDAPDDSDGDGIPDAIDNCPTVANANQRDFDGDGHGDVCDKCPHLASAADPDADGDGVGDACDPRPGTADKFVYWSGFYDDADLAGWTTTGTWSVQSHALVQTATDADVAAFAPISVTNGVVSTAMMPTAFGTASGFLVPSQGPVINAGNNQVYSAGLFSFNGVNAFVRGNGFPRTASQKWPDPEPGSQLSIVMTNGDHAVFTGPGSTLSLSLGGGVSGPAGVFTRLSSASFAYLFVVDQP